LLVFTIPLVRAVLLLFHPNPEGGPFEAIRDVVDRWLIVHVGQLVLTPLLVFAVWRLLDRLPSGAAKVARGAAVVWAAFFTAYDSIQGIATGLLIRCADGDLTGEEEAGVTRALGYLVSDSLLAGNISAVGLIGNAAWLAVAIGTAVALHKAGAGKWAVIAACLSADQQLAETGCVHSPMTAARADVTLAPTVHEEVTSNGRGDRWSEHD
jgi:hypothetical protein